MNNTYKSILFCAFFVSSSIQAESFDDEATWRASAGTFKQETFDNAETLSVDSISRGVQITELPSLDLILHNATYIYDGSSSGPIQSEPFSLINVYPFNSSFLPAISFSPKNQNSLISAVGFYNSSGDDILIMKFYDLSGNLIESTIINAHNSIPVFGGLINAEGAAKVTIEGTGNANNWIAIDNLQVTIKGGSVIKPQISVNGGFIKLDTTHGNAPDISDCENVTHDGRMVFDEVNEVLYICSSNGWISK